MGVSATEHAVVIAGGGPTGLMLAAELTLAGVDVVIVERRPGREVESSRAGGMQARTLEVLDQRGVADRFVVEGQAMQVLGFTKVRLDISDFPTRFNHGLALWQRDIERILAGWVLDDLAVPILHGRSVVGFDQDGAGVAVEVSHGAGTETTTLRAQYLVGCDGGRSVVRKTAGIEFAGWDPTMSFMIAEVDATEVPPLGALPEGGGIGPVNWQDGGTAGPYRMVLKEAEVPASPVGEPSLDDLRQALVERFGSDFGVHDASYISRFGDTSRQAVSYRSGRVLLAGDSAHVHSPVGGQGLNTGVQDAVNLGWKLAQVVRGTSPDSLLDTYQAERHPVAARVLQSTMAQGVLMDHQDDRHQALATILGDLLVMDEPRKRIAGMLSALDVHYDLGEGHPLLGRRMPDLDLHLAAGGDGDGATRVFALLHDARPVLLNLSEPGVFDPSGWAAGRVRLVEAEHTGPWELPVLGEVPAPPAVLIRPDGHVAWTGSLTDADLPDALTRWFGAPSARGGPGVRR